MLKGFFNVPTPTNEPVYSYAPGTKERSLLKEAIAAARASEIDIPMYIGGEEVRTNKKVKITPPHDHKHVLGYFNQGTKANVKDAIEAALAAKPDWGKLTMGATCCDFLESGRIDFYKIPL
ncbi:1-pyrroline-5-carboxylate dehydrogenase [Sphingobacterium daejeonense]|nr:1-pyrroline-5-carboxylate dehydrogenase [Sphingobacterium daejeonense]